MVHAKTGTDWNRCSREPMILGKPLRQTFVVQYTIYFFQYSCQAVGTTVTINSFADKNGNILELVSSHISLEADKTLGISDEVKYL